MGIRVIGGELRGRRLLTEDLPGLRPTTDRVRESLFNILVSRVDIEDVQVLDLCAGSGALGIEAISRGAAGCVFVEKGRRTSRLLQRNIEALGLESVAQVIIGDVSRSMDRLHKEGRAFDLILADPPYRASFLSELLERVPNLLLPEGICVFEHAPKASFVQPDSLERIFERTFGQTAVSIFSLGTPSTTQTLLS